MKITLSVEEKPIGTATPLYYARKYLETDNSSGLFFVFNSDITCSYPLEKLIEFHKLHGKEGTIMVTKVDEP